MKIENVIILGGHIQALGLARQAHQVGLKVVLLLEDGFSVARFSNAVNEVVVCADKYYLKELIQPYAGRQTLLFPTSDDYIEYLTENYADLSQTYTLGIPGPDCVQIFANKRKTYQFAEKEAIPCPKSFYPDNMDDVMRISEMIDYPTVVKPAVMHTFHKMFGKKAYRCDNAVELIALCEKLGKHFPLDGLVIQEFLSGGAESLYSFAATVIKGVPIAWIMANRIRQNPMDFGNSTTFAVTCDIPEIEESARRILKKVDYEGLAEVEFMYDDKSGTYKFLEINTRAWKWHTISMGLGYGFFSELLHYYNGEACDFKIGYRKMAWVERLTDYVVSLKAILSGRLALGGVLRTYFQKKVSAVWSWKDPLPALMYILQSPILFIKRY